MADVASTDHLRAQIDPFIKAWHPPAHPFLWPKKSVATIMAGAPALATCD
jgi:hypothetical protein